jgi:hypothetical protein
LININWLKRYPGIGIFIAFYMQGQEKLGSRGV